MAGKQVRLKVGHTFIGAGENKTNLKFEAGKVYDEETLKKKKISPKEYEEVEEKK